MYTLTIHPQLDTLHAYRTQFQQFPTLLKTAFDRASRSERAALLNDLRTEPDREPTLPFIWSNDPAKQARARRYYFGVILKGRKSKGGRYVRTHELVNAWTLTYDKRAFDGAITASNPAVGLSYVIGDYQVPSHQETGWYDVEDVLEAHRVHFNTILDSVFLTVTDPVSTFG